MVGLGFLVTYLEASIMELLPTFESPIIMTFTVLVLNWGLDIRY